MLKQSDQRNAQLIENIDFKRFKQITSTLHNVRFCMAIVRKDNIVMAPSMHYRLLCLDSLLNFVCNSLVDKFPTYQCMYIGCSTNSIIEQKCPKTAILVQQCWINKSINSTRQRFTASILHKINEYNNNNNNTLVVGKHCLVNNYVRTY